MSTFKKIVRANPIVIGGLFVAVTVLLSMCEYIKRDDGLSGVVDASGEDVAGTETCPDCQQSIAESDSHTPHFLTSRPGTNEPVLGSFDSGKNVYALSERLKVVMEETPSGPVRRAFVAGKEVGKKPIDITLGSGRQGQTYLFWEDDVLFQLPVSYHAPSSTWSNSPGYPTGQILFNRSVSSRCLECHSTHFKAGKTISDNETF